MGLDDVAVERLDFSEGSPKSGTPYFGYREILHQVERGEYDDMGAAFGFVGAVGSWLSDGKRHVEHPAVASVGVFRGYPLGHVFQPSLVGREVGEKLDEVDGSFLWVHVSLDMVRISTHSSDGTGKCESFSGLASSPSRCFLIFEKPIPCI